MSYKRRNWKDGEVITVEKLNNIEEGIAEAKETSNTNTLPEKLTIGSKSYNGTAAVDMTAEVKKLINEKIKYGTTEVKDGDPSPYAEGTLYVVI